MGGKGDPLRTMQEIKISPYEQMMYAQARTCAGEKSWRLGDICCYLNSCERPSADADVKNSQGAK